MHRFLRILLGALVSLVVLILLAVFVVTNTDWGREQVRVRAVAAIAGAANGVVKVGRISGNLLSGLTLHDLSITDSSGAPFLAADEAHSAYGMRALISRKIELSDVRLVRPVVVLDRPPQGRWNFERIFPADTTPTVSDSTGIGFGDWLVLNDVQLVDGHVTIRTPWTPDSSLTETARAALIETALAGDTRTRVVRAPGGYQQVQEFQSLYATMPLVRIAHPDHETRLIRIDSLRTKALLFTPPAANVEHFAGAFELDNDSLWFSVPHLQLPNSRMVSEGRYMLETGDLAVRASASPAAFADLRFAYPALPESGTASFEAALVMEGQTQHIGIHNLDMATNGATARGTIGLTLGDTIHVHETDLTFNRVSTRLIEQMVPGLDVPREGLLSGHAVVDGTFNAMQVDGDVTFDDARSGRSRVLAAGELGAANGVFRARGLRVTLSPVQVDLARIAMSDLPIGGVVSGSATLDGSTETRLTARGLDLTHTDRGERSRITGSGAVRLGDVMVLDANVQARPISLVTIGRFAPDAGLRGEVAGPIRVSGPLSNLSINSTLRTSDGGVISAQGLLDVASAEMGYDLQVATVLFNANSLVATAPITSISAEATARGRGVDPATMQADLFANVSTSTFDTVAVDSVQARVLIGNGVASVDTLFIRAPGAAIDVTGTFGLAKSATGTLAYRVRIDSLSKLDRYFPDDSGIVSPRPLRVAEALERARADSAREAQRLAVARAAGAAPPASPVVIDTPPGIPRDSLAGMLRADGVLNGGLGGFDLRGTLEAESLFVMGNSVRRARADYTWMGALTPEARITTDLSAHAVFASGFELDSVDVEGHYLKPGGTANVTIFQNNTRDYSIRADYALYPDRRELRFADLNMRFDTTRWASTGPGSVLWGQPGIEIERIELRNNAGGRIFADGRLPSEGPANLQLSIANLEIANVLGMVQSDIPARGLLTLDAKVTGTGASPVLAGTTSVREAQYKGTAAPDLAATFDYANTLLNAQVIGTDDGRELVTATGALPINLAMQGVTGSRLPDAPATIDLRADSLPLDLISRFTDVVAQTGGHIEGSGSLRGPIREPTLAGDLAIANAQARVVPLGILLSGINGSLQLRNDTIVVDSITADSRGRIDLRGAVGVANFAAPSFDLTFRAQRARVLDNDMGRLHADANITVRGPFDNTVVEGSARIREGVFYIPRTDNTEVINADDPSVFQVVDTLDTDVDRLVPGQSPFLANLQMNLTLGVDRDTWVRSAEANVEVYSDGDLQINIDRRRNILTLDGVVNTERGEYSFMSKRFNIQRGAATFVGTTEIDPLVQLTAEYEVKRAAQEALTISIHVGGTVTRPRITLDSDAQPPISQSDLLSYLAFGSESGSLLQFGGGSSLSGNTAGGGLVGTSAALATRQLTGVALGVAVKELEGEGIRSLGADVFNITPADVPPEIASGNFGAFATFLKGTQLEVGKYVNTQTFIGLNLQATSTPGFRVEHRFRNRPGLSLESTFEPRFFLPEPSLAEQELRKANAFGLFLVRRWRF